MNVDVDVMTEDARERFFNARLAFLDSYCAAKTWDANRLSWEQIVEIRAQPEWNAPPVIADAETLDCIPEDACEVCGGTNDVGAWGTGEKAMFDVCAKCFSGAAFKEFLVREFERALLVHDHERKLPDGRWTKISS